MFNIPDQPLWRGSTALLSFKLNHIYYGWWIVASSFVLNALCTGVYFLGFSVFFLPITRDLQISRAAASLPFSLARVLSALIIPLLGMTVDRLGPAKLLLVGGLLAGLGYLLLSWSPNYIIFLIVFVFAITLGIQSGFDAPSFPAVNQWFEKKRGFAFAIAASGYAFGGATIIPLTALGVKLFGWRTSAFVVGVLIFIIIIPLFFLLRRSPKEEELLIEGLASTSSPIIAPSHNLSPPILRSGSNSISFRSALKTRTYWFLAFSYGIRGMVWGGFTMHLVAVMVWKGLEESTAGLLVGAFPLCWMVFTPGMGWLADRWSKQHLAATSALSGAIGMLMLVFLDSVSIWQMLGIFILLAPNEGSWPLGWAILSNEFGSKNFGALRGGVLAMVSFLGIGAPVFSGWVFDTTQSYYWVVLPSAVLLGAAGVLNWAMPPAMPRLPEIKGKRIV